MTDAKLKTIGISAAALAALAAIGLILYALWDGIKNLFSGAESILTAAGTAADISTSTFDTTKGSSLLEGDKKTPLVGRPQLKLKVRYHRNINRTAGGFGTYRNEVGFEVLDPNGQPVPYATLIGVPNTKSGRVVLGDRITRRTNSAGRWDGYWEVNSLYDTNKDNVTWFARREGYNDSASITIE